MKHRQIYFGFRNGNFVAMTCMARLAHRVKQIPERFQNFRSPADCQCQRLDKQKSASIDKKTSNLCVGIAFNSMAPTEPTALLLPQACECLR